MTQIHYKSAFKDITDNDLKEWLRFNHDRLVGSAIFTKQNSLTSKLVRWGEKHLFAQCKSDNCFTPSHTGSIIDYKDDLYIFDMKPPKASVQPLYDYLRNTKEDYVLVLRDFPLNIEMFSKNLEFHIGEFYAYLSALRSVFTKRNTKYVRHCSEMHLRELQKQNLFTKVNPEITPDELFHLLKKGWEKR